MKSDLQLLLEYRTEALGAIYGSTGSERVRAALAQFVDSRLEAGAGRAAAALQRSHERSSAIRSAIDQATVAIPLGRPTSELVYVARGRLYGNPHRYGLERAPSARVIREVIRQKKSGTFGTEATEQPLSNTEHE